MLPAVGVAGPDSSISTKNSMSLCTGPLGTHGKGDYGIQVTQNQETRNWAPPGPFPVTMSVYANPGTHTSSGQCYTAQAGHSLAKASPRWKPASPNETVTLFTAALNGTEVLRLFLQDPKK